MVGNPDESRLEASHRDNFFSAPPAGFQRLQLATADDLDLFRSHDADGGGDGEFVVANGPGGGERPTLAGGSSGGNGSGGSGSGGGSDQNNADDVTPAVEPTVGDSNPAFKETELVLDIPRADSPRGSMDDPLAGGAASPAGRASTESDLIPKHSPTLTEAVPEPTSWVLMILGFGLIGATLRGQKRTGLLA